MTITYHHVWIKQLSLFILRSLQILPASWQLLSTLSHVPTWHALSCVKAPISAKSRPRAAAQRHDQLLPPERPTRRSKQRPPPQQRPENWSRAGVTALALFSMFYDEKMIATSRKLPKESDERQQRKKVWNKSGLLHSWKPTPSPSRVTYFPTSSQQDGIPRCFQRIQQMLPKGSPKQNKSIHSTKHLVAHWKLLQCHNESSLENSARCPWQNARCLLLSQRQCLPFSPKHCSLWHKRSLLVYVKLLHLLTSPFNVVWVSGLVEPLAHAFMTCLTIGKRLTSSQVIPLRNEFLWRLETSLEASCSLCFTANMATVISSLWSTPDLKKNNKNIIQQLCRFTTHCSVPRCEKLMQSALKFARRSVKSHAFARSASPAWAKAVPKRHEIWMF